MQHSICDCIKRSECFAVYFSPASLNCFSLSLHSCLTSSFLIPFSHLHSHLSPPTLPWFSSLSLPSHSLSVIPSSLDSHHPFNSLPLHQCFPTLFLEAQQQCTYWMSPLSDQYMYGHWVSTNVLMSWFRCVWLGKVGKCVVLVCLQEQGWETLLYTHLVPLTSPSSFPLSLTLGLVSGWLIEGQAEGDNGCDLQDDECDVL